MRGDEVLPELGLSLLDACMTAASGGDDGGSSSDVASNDWLSSSSSLSSLPDVVYALVSQRCGIDRVLRALRICKWIPEHALVGRLVDAVYAGLLGDEWPYAASDDHDKDDDKDDENDGPPLLVKTVHSLARQAMPSRRRKLLAHALAIERTSNCTATATTAATGDLSPPLLRLFRSDRIRSDTPTFLLVLRKLLAVVATSEDRHHQHRHHYYHRQPLPSAMEYLSILESLEWSEEERVQELCLRLVMSGRTAHQYTMNTSSLIPMLQQKIHSPHWAVRETVLSCVAASLLPKYDGSDDGKHHDDDNDDNDNENVPPPPPSYPLELTEIVERGIVDEETYVCVEAIGCVQQLVLHGGVGTSATSSSTSTSTATSSSCENQTSPSSFLYWIDRIVPALTDRNDTCIQTRVTQFLVAVASSMSSSSISSAAMSSAAVWAWLADHEHLLLHWFRHNDVELKCAILDLLLVWSSVSSVMSSSTSSLPVSMSPQQATTSRDALLALARQDPSPLVHRALRPFNPPDQEQPPIVEMDRAWTVRHHLCQQIHSLLQDQDDLNIIDDDMECEEGHLHMACE